ncbi:MAG: SMC-Scp complex subunit ScpB [Candidatus Omnitrophota bacterium]|jgi:segregation and condensation protein B
MPENNVASVLEALLFVSDKPLALEQIRSALDNLGTSDIRRVIEELNSGYEQSNRGIRISEIAGGFQMVTAGWVAPFLKKLYKQRHVERLSRPALETLAIVAYKQPVTKAEISSLRNVNIDGVVATLLDKELIRVAGRKKAPGRPRVYGTTRQFLERFGLKSLEDLPKIENFPDVDSMKEVIVEGEAAALKNNPAGSPEPAAGQKGDAQSEPEKTAA